MSRITTVKYAVAYQPAFQQAKIDRLAKIAEMKAAGKTDDVAYYIDDGLARTYQRTWTTEADAQEYLDFINAIEVLKTNIVISRIEPEGATIDPTFSLWVQI